MSAKDTGFDDSRYPGSPVGRGPGFTWGRYLSRLVIRHILDEAQRDGREVTAREVAYIANSKRTREHFQLDEYQYCSWTWVKQIIGSLKGGAQ